MRHRLRQLIPGRRVGGLAAALAVALGGLVLPASRAEAEPCKITVGGHVGYYICAYPKTQFDFQGRDHVFVIGTDYAVWHIYETGVNTYQYSDWISLGGTARSRVKYGISGGNNDVLQIIVRGTFNGCWNRFYNYPNNRNRWTDWYDQPDPPGDAFCGT